MSGKRMRKSEVVTFVSKAMKDHWRPPRANQMPNIFKLWDGTYQSISKGRVESLIKNVCKTVPKYKPVKFDCDDQAFFFKSACAKWSVDQGWTPYALIVGIAEGRFKWVAGDHVTCWIVYEGKDGTVMKWFDPELAKLDPKRALQPLDQARWVKFLLV